MLEGTEFLSTTHSDGKDTIKTTYLDFDDIENNERVKTAWDYMTSNGGEPPSNADTIHVIDTTGTDAGNWSLINHGWTSPEYRAKSARLGDIPNKIMREQAEDAYRYAVVYQKPTVTVVDRCIGGEKLHYTRLLLPRGKRLYAAMLHRRPRSLSVAESGFWLPQQAKRLVAYLQSLRRAKQVLRVGSR